MTKDNYLVTSLCEIVVQATSCTTYDIVMYNCDRLHRTIPTHHIIVIFIYYINKCFTEFYNHEKLNSMYSQTCIKRSPLGQKKEWSFKTCDLLKEVQFI